jgi:hypothetical protein
MRNRVSSLAMVALLVSPAAALDFPARKPGLWELKTHVEGKGIASPIMKQCVDAATDAQMQSFGASMGAKMCSEQTVKRDGDDIISDAVCRIGPIAMRTHSVTTGDFNSAYTTKTTSKQEGGPTLPGLGDSTMVIEARWIGPCEADQQPGDVILGNGVKLNIGEMKNLMPGGPSSR